MNFTLSFTMDNAAFEDEPATESARILRDIAEKVEAGHGGGKIRDINGNSIGTWSVEE